MAAIESIYELLTDDNDGRICRDIDDSACRETPRNFGLILISYCLTKLGDAIASPKTTLAWLTPMLGAPAWVLGLLVPIRESGAMIPQLLLGGYIRKMALRKWIWVAGSIGQGLCIAGIGAAAVTLRGVAAGWALLIMVTLFSLARALSSIAAKDVLGKTIPKEKRGQLTGWSASASGLLVVAIGIVLMISRDRDFGIDTLAMLLLLAAALWLIAALVYSGIEEHHGETGGGGKFSEALDSLTLLRTDRAFRRFVLTRALLMCSALSAPFYVALAQTRFNDAPALLGGFIIAAGVASLISAPVWGRFADRSSRNVMVVAALITAATGFATFAAIRLLPEISASVWFLPACYFVLSLAHSGVRVGRKTYVVNLGSGNDRTRYVSVSNTVIGILLLLVGGVGMLAGKIGNDGVIALLATMGTAGALLGSRLRDI